MKAIITGVTGFTNRGVEALVRTTVDQLLQRYPNLAIDIMTDDIAYDHLRLQQDNINFFHRIPETLPKRVINRASKYYKPLAPAYPRFKEASIVIASGGDIFSSDYAPSLRTHMPPLELALNADIPIVFLAQSIAFKNKDVAERWLRVARHAKLITVREKISYKYVTQELGLSTDIVKHTADSAFLLEPSPVKYVSNLLKSYGVTKDRPIIAISPSQSIAGYVGSDQDRHLNSWHQTIQFIINELDAQILIIPHVQNKGIGSDDRIIATNLHKSLDFNPQIHLVGGDHSASEFKGLIGACDLLIAERMHAAIAGLSSGVATMVVGYSVKAEGIMTDMLGEELVKQGLVIPIQEFLDTDVAYDALKFAWENRDEVSRQLQEVLPRVKKSAASNFDMISKVLT